MHIQLEHREPHSIQSYSDNEIKVNDILYHSSVIVSRDFIFPDWEIQQIQDLSIEQLAPLVKTNPELILIGHRNTGALPDIELVSYLSKLRIGFEVMSIGAASRTYNVLLSEQRLVIAGFILTRSC